MVEETEGRRRGNPAAAFVLCIVLLLLLYIASPVPVAYVLNHSASRGNAPQAVQRIYSPFAWARQHARLRKPIDSYGSFLNKI